MHVVSRCFFHCSFIAVIAASLLFSSTPGIFLILSNSTRVNLFFQVLLLWRCIDLLIACVAINQNILAHFSRRCFCNKVANIFSLAFPFRILPFHVNLIDWDLLYRIHIISYSIYLLHFTWNFPQILRTPVFSYMAHKFALLSLLSAFHILAFLGWNLQSQLLFFSNLFIQIAFFFALRKFWF